MNSSLDRPKLSVILPSYNGEDTLPDCLDALRAVLRPDGGAEFIFIDNRSTDGTGRLLAAAAAALCGTVLSEGRPGKSHALNTAIAAARGDLLVFTDDDTLPDPGWLTGFAKAADAHPDVGIFAGQIRPHWVANVSGWLQELTERGLACGCTPAVPPVGPYPHYWVKGGNLMLRRSSLSGRGFDTEAVNFGSSAAAIGGEDTKLVHDLLTAGEQIRYVPDACVRHILQPEESTLRFILTRQVRIGRGSAIIDGIRLPRVFRLCTDIGAYLLIAPALYATGKKASAAQQMMKSARRLGMLQVWLGGRS